MKAPSYYILGGPMVAIHCEFARQWRPEMPTRGFFPGNYPLGAVVHFTAGRPGTGAVSYGTKMGFAYWYIDKDGSLYQTHDLSRWGSHAGKSHWPGLGDSVSRFLLGIEIAGAGKVAPGDHGKFKTWYGEEVGRERVRTVTKEQGYTDAGHFEAYTEAQEATLIRLLLWLKKGHPNHFSFDLCLGHAEVSPGRKNDPSGAMSMTMPGLRALLRAKARGST